MIALNLFTLATRKLDTLTNTIASIHSPVRSHRFVKCIGHSFTHSTEVMSGPHTNLRHSNPRHKDRRCKEGREGAPQARVDETYNLYIDNNRNEIPSSYISKS